jgi:hypothetical protein
MMDREFTVPFGGNRYCGPFALAHILRTDTNRASAELRKVSGKRYVKGVRSKYVLEVLNAHGFALVDETPHPSVQLQTWMRDYWSDPDGLYPVNITGHYLIVDGGEYFDNACHLGKPLERCPHLRRKVKSIWSIKQYPFFTQPIAHERA